MSCAAAAPGLRHHVVVLAHQQNLGFVRSCNEAFAATAGRDVVLLNSDVIVGPEWLTRLRDAASGDTTATASTLTNHGTMLSVPWRNAPTSRLPDGMSPQEAAKRVAAASLRLRPSLPTAVGHCCYIRRQALDLVGGFDETFSPGYGEEVDFSQRCITVGLRHVCADDVFTFHRGRAQLRRRRGDRGPPGAPRRRSSTAGTRGTRRGSCASRPTTARRSPTASRSPAVPCSG